jgi:hypothetical protein
MVNLNRRACEEAVAGRAKHNESSCPRRRAGRVRAISTGSLSRVAPPFVVHTNRAFGCYERVNCVRGSGKVLAGLPV